MFLGISLYSSSIKRLVKQLNEYRDNKHTYAEPEKYLEMILSSVATEINREIEHRKGVEASNREKATARAKKPVTSN